MSIFPPRLLSLVIYNQNTLTTYQLRRHSLFWYAIIGKKTAPIYTNSYKEMVLSFFTYSLPFLQTEFFFCIPGLSHLARTNRSFFILILVATARHYDKKPLCISSQIVHPSTPFLSWFSLSKLPSYTTHPLALQYEKQKKKLFSFLGKSIFICGISFLLVWITMITFPLTPKLNNTSTTLMKVQELKAITHSLEALDKKGIACLEMAKKKHTLYFLFRSFQNLSENEILTACKKQGLRHPLLSLTSQQVTNTFPTSTQYRLVYEY